MQVAMPNTQMGNMLPLRLPLDMHIITIKYHPAFCRSKTVKMHAQEKGGGGGGGGGGEKKARFGG